MNFLPFLLTRSLRPITCWSEYSCSLALASGGCGGKLSIAFLVKLNFLDVLVVIVMTLTSQEVDVNLSKRLEKDGHRFSRPLFRAQESMPLNLLFVLRVKFRSPSGHKGEKRGNSGTECYVDPT